jgi:hypothetical protein
MLDYIDYVFVVAITVLLYLHLISTGVTVI